jgi:hypothetical protein
MSHFPNRLGSKRWNAHYERNYRKAMDFKKRQMAKLMADGIPPGSVEESPQAQFDLLEAARATGAPWFFDGPLAAAAQKDYWRLRTALGLSKRINEE